MKRGPVIGGGAVGWDVPVENISAIVAIEPGGTPQPGSEQYNADGGDATVIDLPKIGITGNSHFMFQELNNQEIADHIEAWLGEHGLN